MSWGPLIFGHADPETLAAVGRGGRATGRRFGAPTEREVELAAEIVDAVPSVEMVRLVSSGTEAVDERDPARARLHAPRPRSSSSPAATTATPTRCSRAPGSGLATLGIPASPGVPSRRRGGHDRLPVQRRRRGRRGGRASRARGSPASIVEPVAGNMGVVPPAPGFLEALRALCDASGALLVFDEVITGFRVARGGAQERYGVTPDLTILGKIVGGGLPLAAFGGRADVMDQLAPAGAVYQAGTLSGNPLATAAGLSVLRRLRDAAVYEQLEARGARLEAGLAPFGTRAAGRRDADALRRGRAGARLRGRAGVRHGALRRALPPPARARRLPGAVAVRGDVRLARARRRRDRQDGGGGCRFFG